MSDILIIKHNSSIFRQSSNPVCGFSMMEHVRLCCLAHGELVWLFLEPDTGLGHCPSILLSCFKARTSGHCSCETAIVNRCIVIPCKLQLRLQPSESPLCFNLNSGGRWREGARSITITTECPIYFETWVGLTEI